MQMNVALLRRICSDFMQNFIQVNFLATARGSEEVVRLRFRGERNKTWNHWMRNVLSLSVFLPFLQVWQVHRGKLSPFFLRRPIVPVPLSDNSHYESRYRDKTAGYLVANVRPCWVLRRVFRSEFHQMKNGRFNEADHPALTAGCKGKGRSAENALNLKTNFSANFALVIANTKGARRFKPAARARWSMTMWLDSSVILWIICEK